MTLWDPGLRLEGFCLNRNTHREPTLSQRPQTGRFISPVSIGQRLIPPLPSKHVHVLCARSHFVFFRLHASQARLTVGEVADSASYG